MLAYLRSKNFHTFLGGYSRFLLEPKPKVQGPRHLLFAFCDHYEPGWGDAVDSVGDARVRAWSEGYPKLAGDFRDADGHHPRHSFFFPGEQYRPQWLEALADLARAGFGEVEFHLHHDNDTPGKLRADITQYLRSFAEHGHLSRDPDGRLRYAFIHGNWCLANSRKDGKRCGVDEEIPLLFDTGCYADYTFPSFPDESQPNIVNRIYWPTGDLAQRRAYERGVRACVGEVMHDRILMIQGPLGMIRRRTFSPGVEYGAVTAHEPGSDARVRVWTEQGIHVEGRPEWVFVKVYTHGAPEPQAASLLGDGGRALHQALSRYNDGRNWVLHYMTAREMFNVAIAAMEGRSGNPNEYRDYQLKRPPLTS